MPSTTPPSYLLHDVVAGTRTRNLLPHAPAGQTLARIWTLISRERLAEVGLVHNDSAFLEDHIHDYRLEHEEGGDTYLRYYSRVVETGHTTTIVLEFAPAGARRRGR